MKKYFFIAIIVIVASLLVAFNYDKKDDKQVSVNDKVSIQLSWIPSGTFGGDAASIVKFANIYGLDLENYWGGPGINPIQIVQSGRAMFGHSGADEVLSANDKGAELVILGVINHNSLAGFISLSEKNIKTPQDLEGKKVGIIPYGNTTMVYESLLEKNNIDRSKINEITVSNDLKAFLSDVYDVQPVFINDETVDFDRENIPYNLIEPKNFNVNIKGLVYFTKKETLQKNPEIVKNFVYAMADGWNYAIENPKEAIDMLKIISPEINTERETQVLSRGIPYFTIYNDEPLNSDLESWDDMISILKQSGLVKNDVNLSEVLQFQFINEYYNNKK